MGARRGPALRHETEMRFGTSSGAFSGQDVIAWKCNRSSQPGKGQAMSHWARQDDRVVGVANAYKGCRTPMPSMKRSLIWAGSRRVVPTPPLSSIRTPISVGPTAFID